MQSPASSIVQRTSVYLGRYGAEVAFKRSYETAYPIRCLGMAQMCDVHNGTGTQAPIPRQRQLASTISQLEDRASAEVGRGFGCGWLRLSSLLTRVSRVAWCGTLVVLYPCHHRTGAFWLASFVMRGMRQGHHTKAQMGQMGCTRPCPPLKQRLRT